MCDKDRRRGPKNDETHVTYSMNSPNILCRCNSVVQYNARNSAAVKLDTKASQRCKKRYDMDVHDTSSYTVTISWELGFPVKPSRYFCDVVCSYKDSS
ncbi:hypothetical protein EVAR_25425_1 [Eumeta japonica]|uniref:Uncharacterized protein n=1 Tax=Eumeta variegata TaxID=151549 RepID=A0A4C1V700_EUMVA|nr:hypothetical protein EVAR_25425_1 [Eumeta japonica]